MLGKGGTPFPSHLNYLDFKSAALIIKNKEHLNSDGIGLEKVIQLKKKITSFYKNKTVNNHSED